MQHYVWLWKPLDYQPTEPIQHREVNHRKTSKHVKRDQPITVESFSLLHCLLAYLPPVAGVKLRDVKRVERLTQRSDVLYEVSGRSFALQIKHEPQTNKII